MTKGILILTVFILLWSAKGFAQRTATVSDGSTIIIEYLLQGDSLFKLGEIDKAISAYRMEYELYPTLGAYGLACSFARANKPDSSFKYLFENLATDSTEFTLINPDFLALRSDVRWIQVENLSIQNIVAKTPGYIRDVKLARKLWYMYALDQAYYYEISIADLKLGRDSPVSQALWKLKGEVNSRNQIMLDSILSDRGWPTITDVGKAAATAAFLIIQHSDIEKQLYYLPTIKTLCENNEADWQSYALMYDRIQYSLGQPQCYGSQVIINEQTGKYEVFEIEDEKNVDIRRKQIGLVPLKDYLEPYGINYASGN